MNFDLIPSSLKNLPNWVMWQLEDRHDKTGKKAKVPYQTNGKKALTNKPSTWCSFEQALNAYQSDQFNGIGFVVKATINNQPLVGIDIDYPFDSEISKEIISHFPNTYCEQSPSGKLRIFCTGVIPRSGKGESDKLIEVYDEKSPRYLTVTGHHLAKSSTEINLCQDGIDWLFKRFFTTTITNSLPLPKEPIKTPFVSKEVIHSGGDVLSDEQVIALCRRAKNSSKFDALFNGGGHKDESGGDLALCKIIAFYAKSTTGQGVSQIDRIVRQSSRVNVHNGKWDEIHDPKNQRTYGQMTCQKAYDGQQESYKPTKKNWVKKYLPQTTVDWYSKIACTVNKDGHEFIRGNIYNMLLIMRNDENLKGLFGFNEFTGKYEKLKMSTIVGLSEGELEDNDITHVRDYISGSLKMINSHLCSWEAGDTLSSIICVAEESYSFHPVKEYLNSLKWDGTSRIDHFFADHCGTTYDQYSSFVGKSFFISQVARVMRPGCKLDTMPILEGSQGMGKSTLFRSLCPKEEWFGDSAIDFNSKDAYIGSLGKWIRELPELDALNKAETTKVKGFISSPTDSYRPPYGKFNINVPRQYGFVGTTNKSNYLKDETGNRRFLPLKCEWIDIDAIVAIRDQLWAEAVVRYQNGEKWHYDKEDKELFDEITKQQESRFEGDAWQSTIEIWVDSHNDFTIADVATGALDLELRNIDRRIEIRIGKILQFIGYDRIRKRINGQKRYVYSKVKQPVKPFAQSQPVTQQEIDDVKNKCGIETLSDQEIKNILINQRNNTDNE